MKTVLVVEDDEPLAYALAKQLETAGNGVRTVTSRMAALDVLDSNADIDLVLSDLVMPPGQPSGLALGRMARMKRQGSKVVFMSGYDVDGLALPDRLFRKPLQIDHLIAE